MGETMYAADTAIIARRDLPSYSPRMVAPIIRGRAPIRRANPGVPGLKTRRSAAHAVRRRSSVDMATCPLLLRRSAPETLCR
jgi:hypothetical protein